MKPNELQRLLKNAKVVRVPISEEETTLEMDANLVMVPRVEYANLVRKAAMLDALSDDLRARVARSDHYPVNDDIVMAVTGVNRYQDVLSSEREEIKKKAEDDSKKIADLECQIEKLKVQLSVIRDERDIARAEVYDLKAGGGKQEEPHE